MERNGMVNAVAELKQNLRSVARVFEWAELMGYENPKRFSEIFLRHYGVRPQKIMELIRLESIIRELREPHSQPNIRIARKHSLPNEKTLNNFTNYHTGHSPTAIKQMTGDEIAELKDQLWKQLMEEYGIKTLVNFNT